MSPVNMQDYPPLSSKIKELREKNGLNKARFAELIGVSPTMMTRWEDGTAEPTVTTLHSIAAACKVDIHWFFTSTTERQRTDISTVALFLSDGRPAGFLPVAVSNDKTFAFAVRADAENSMPSRGIFPGSLVLVRFAGKIPQGALCVVKTHGKYLIRTVLKYKQVGYILLDEQQNAEEIKVVLVGKGKEYEIFPVVKIITDCVSEDSQPAMPKTYVKEM